MALRTLCQQALLLQKANAGIAIGGVRSVARDARSSLCIGLLPTQKGTMKVPIKVIRIRRVGVALQAMCIGDGLRRDRGLCRCACEPLHGIVRAQAHGTDAACKAWASVAPYAGDIGLAGLLQIFLREQCVNGSQINRFASLRALVIGGLWLGMARRTEGIVLFQVSNGEETDDSDEAACKQHTRRRKPLPTKRQHHPRLSAPPCLREKRENLSLGLTHKPPPNLPRRNGRGWGRV